ncbi:MAG: homoserine O-acetyltransferase, partial [Sulfurovum sp.]|nr:homoserine O-acetyltransferase [Sulfurovum sp.]
NTFNLSRGYDSLYDAVIRIKARMHLISFSTDYLFFPEEMEHIYKMMQRNNQGCTYLEVNSEYGHDAFLVELEKFDQSIKEILK